MGLLTEQLWENFVLVECTLKLLGCDACAVLVHLTHQFDGELTLLRAGNGNQNTTVSVPN